MFMSRFKSIDGRKRIIGVKVNDLIVKNPDGTPCKPHVVERKPADLGPLPGRLKGKTDRQIRRLTGGLMLLGKPTTVHCARYRELQGAGRA